VSADGAAGLHTRAGNTMSRTREGLLDGALSAIERVGVRRLTMSAVSQRAGVAKATLYNHFRTKDDLLAALVDREVRDVAERALRAAADGTPADGLDRAATDLGEHVAVRRVLAAEPELAVVLVTPTAAPTWGNVRAGLADLLGTPNDDPAVDVCLSWLLGQLVAPQEPAARRAAADLLAASIRTRV
jgi:AcrR family transcriptional regulator